MKKKNHKAAATTLRTFGVAEMATIRIKPDTVKSDIEDDSITVKELSEHLKPTDRDVWLGIRK